MLTKQQLKIFGLFKKGPFTKLVFRQIKVQSGQKSNNVVQLALKVFQNENLVRIEKIGDIATYSLNLDNNLTLAYLNLVNDLELSSSKKLPKHILEKVCERILRYSEFFILLVFGSYAKNKATSKSDLDIAVIVETQLSKKAIIPSLETIKRREIIKLDYHVFTRKEFLEMLSVEQETVGKEIYRKSLIYYGLVPYYQLINKVMHERRI